MKSACRVPVFLDPIPVVALAQQRVTSLELKSIRIIEPFWYEDTGKWALAWVAVHDTMLRWIGFQGLQSWTRTT